MSYKENLAADAVKKNNRRAALIDESNYNIIWLNDHPSDVDQRYYNILFRLGPNYDWKRFDGINYEGLTSASAVVKSSIEYWLDQPVYREDDYSVGQIDDLGFDYNYSFDENKVTAFVRQDGSNIDGFVIDHNGLPGSSISAVLNQYGTFLSEPLEIQDDNTFRHMNAEGNDYYVVFSFHNTIEGLDDSSIIVNAVVA